MDTYSFFRQIADSWVLLMMFAFFAGAVLWVFRPSAKAAHKDASELPFRNENYPADYVEEDGQ